VWVEAESSKIGEVLIPTELWRAMKAATGVEMIATAAERAAYLLRTYRHFVEQPEQLKALVTRLRHRLGEAVVTNWCAAIDAGRWAEFVTDMLTTHYDPAYRHSRERDFANVREAMEVESLSDEGIGGVAEVLASRPHQGVAV
jgi:tRNA 2-selenouridine synthase